MIFVATSQTSQVNCVISHPADTIIVAGYEDGYINTFDSETCKFLILRVEIRQIRCCMLA